MVDITKQIEFWRGQAQEDWEVACQLVDGGKTRHGLFFGHLALEKLLKGSVCRATEEVAPRIHNLVRLAEIAELNLQPEHLDILAEMNAFNLEGRYPLSFLAPPTTVEGQEYMKRAGEVFEWLIQRL